jgi:membrane-associated protease RseP (regulator of RpoE activity)
MSTFSESQPTPRDDGAGADSRPLEPIVVAEVVESCPRRQLSAPVAAYKWPPQRRIARPLFFFLATCVTTFCAGCYGCLPLIITLGELRGPLWEVVTTNWRFGLWYMVCVIGVLLFHEMGHFLMTVRYRVRSSYPYFIPLPVMLTGTMGAVITMDGRKADRKELFDIGIAGPLAGLVLAVPFTILGIIQAGTVTAMAVPGTLEFGDPLLVTALTPLLREVPTGQVLSWSNNPFLWAGWFGLLVTGLNMMPVSQLDGGHVIHALFGKNARWIARIFLLTVVALMVAFAATQWILMLILVLIIGPDHPPSADDSVDIGWFRRVLGFVSLAIPVLCFPPEPLVIH